MVEAADEATPKVILETGALPSLKDAHSIVPPWKQVPTSSKHQLENGTCCYS